MSEKLFQWDEKPKISLRPKKINKKEEKNKQKKMLIEVNVINIYLTYF